MSNQVAIWIDHKEAHLFHVHAGKVDAETVLAPAHLHHRHPKGPEGGKEHPDDAKRFFHEVTLSLEGECQVLVVGPSSAKLELLRYVEKQHAPRIHIVGVETVDHPTNGQLAAYAKAYFKRLDRLG